MEIYLDNAATTPILPEVRQEMDRAMEQFWGNPSSLHQRGLRAQRCLQEARDKIAQCLGAAPHEIHFTSGGTESNNLAILGGGRRRKSGHIIVSAVEHPSVLEPCRHLEELGYPVTILPVDAGGRIRIEDLVRELRPDTSLVSIMQVSNELGTVQPIGEIVREVRSRSPRALIHTDAVQSFTHIPISVRALGVDMLSISGHKIHGPTGIGVLFVRSGAQPEPLLRGGGQERRLRSGTENYPAAAGFAVAAVAGCRWAMGDGPGLLAALALDTVRSLQQAIPDLVVNGPDRDADRAPHIISFTIPGLESEVLLHAVEARGVFLSAGAACSSRNRGLSATLRAIGRRPSGEAHLRISLNRFQDAAQLKDAAGAIAMAVRELRGAPLER